MIQTEAIASSQVDDGIAIALSIYWILGSLPSQDQLKIGFLGSGQMLDQQQLISEEDAGAATPEIDVTS